MKLMKNMKRKYITLWIVILSGAKNLNPCVIAVR